MTAPEPGAPEELVPPPHRSPWLAARDVRVIALRVLLLGLTCPLLVEAWNLVASAAWLERRLGVNLATTVPWFWRFVLFLVITVVLPISALERVSASRARPRAALAALGAALVSLPGALAAMAQTAYDAAALDGLARAFDAAAALLADTPNVVVGRAVALGTPLALVTWTRVHGLPLALQLAVALPSTTAVALGALLGVAGWTPGVMLLEHTDLWTALATAVLLPPCYAAVDALERRVWPAAPVWREDPPSATTPLA